jgi:hypothetical protein
MTEHTLISLAWWGCPLSANVLAHGLIRRYALAVLASMSLATPLWLLLVWLVTSVLVGGAMRHPRVAHVGRIAPRALAATCAILVASFVAVMVRNAARLGRTKLPPVVAGDYFLQVPRDRAASDALNCDRDLRVNRTSISSRRIDDSTQDWVLFRRVERISETNDECYRYEADRCNGSVCRRDGRHIVLAACAPGESPPCIDPACTAFAGEARRW